MSQEFLRKIRDLNNRIFPLNYKFVNIRRKKKSGLIQTNVYFDVSFYNSSEVVSSQFYKPITKVF